jgi:tetratricopeptide (TPR) repeat protein
MLLVEADPDEAEVVRRFLNTNLLEGRAIGLSHLILGSLDLDRGNQNDAILHLERAYESLPNAEIIANNLAWLLIHSTPPQAERALKIADLCVERFPTVERFRDTRGHALLKLKRYREAVRDLEAALHALRISPGTHRALAEAYKELGLSDLATQHLERAKKLEEGELKKVSERVGG